MSSNTDDLVNEANENNEMNKTDHQETSIHEGSKDQSMEELKMDDNEEKETSLEEDLLGAQSLLMTDSEDEEKPEEMATIPDATESLKIIESHAIAEEQLSNSKQPINENINHDEISDNASAEQKVKRNAFKLVDSESEDDEKSNAPVQKNRTRKLLDSDDENENISQEQIEPANRKKLSNLIDTDSEPEEQMQQTEVPTKKFYKLPNSDSESDSNTTIETHHVKKTKKLQPANSGTESETNDEADESDQETRRYQCKPKKVQKENFKLIDSDNEEPRDAPQYGSAEENPGDSGGKSNEKKIRASAKKAIEEMQAIQSEQQRLHREAHISIPYHKPKKHTLDEFLKRRTIIKPSLDDKDTSSPIATKLQSKNLKMTSEELEEYAKLMEERAKEATEFFKSESEEEEEKMKDNVGVLDTPSTATTIETEKGVQEEIVATERRSLTPESIDKNDNNEPADLHTDELLENSAVVTKSKSPMQILVTEVIELPKLDLSTVHISVDSPTVPTEIQETNISSTPAKPPTPVLAVNPPMSFSPTTSSAASKMQNIKKMLMEETKHTSPVIRGDKNMLIDLDSGELVAKTPTGVDSLLGRLMASKKARKERAPDTVSILSLEHGKLEMSKVHINHHDENEVLKEQKPGAAYLKLKNDLKSIITKKRLEDMKRKKAEEIEHNKLIEGDDDEGMDMDDEEYEPDSKPTKTKEIMIDDEENAVELIQDDDNDAADEVEEDEGEDEEVVEEHEENLAEDEEAADPVEEEEGDDDADDDDDDDDDDSSSESDYEESAQNNIDEDSKRKNRIIKAFQDDSDDDVDDLDLLDSSKMPPPTAPAIIPGQSALFDSEEKKSAIEEENELMGLCSGKFGITQQATPTISQIPKTQTSAAENEEELLALCSGTFDGTQMQDSSAAPATQLATKGNKIVSSDEEADNKVQQHKEQTKERIKKLTKRMKKRKAKLGFSDDEDEEDQAEALASDENDDDDIVDLLEEDEPEAFVDYDSEENEIVVKMTKKDRRERAQNFVEKEAELSESEWGSADEDEKNLDNYDIELGDEDEFDREKLRTELGQIHARKMLDEDAKELRKIQEMLFEDEERDGVGRQRQFRWKNAESGFSLDDTQRGDENNGGEHGDSGDEENEHLWRKIRFEREQLLKEQMQKENLSASNITINSTVTAGLLTNTTIHTKLGTSKKLNIITTKLNATKESKKLSSPFLISKAISTVQSKTVRGSFLVRDKETLDKLAGLTKNKATAGFAGLGADAEETAGTVSTKMSSSKNFVFATLTEEEHECLKRKADDLMNSSNENGINYMKKPKTEPRRDKCFIDQLL